jgi:hypothetical protein
MSDEARQPLVKARRAYTIKYKLFVLEQLHTRPLSLVAKEIGVPIPTIKDWKRQQLRQAIQNQRPHSKRMQGGGRKCILPGSEVICYIYSSLQYCMYSNYFTVMYVGVNFVYK